VLLARTLGPGVYGLSNAALDTPWPKTRRLVQAVHEALPQASDPDGRWLHPLTEVLGDDRCASDEALPRTGVPAAFERSLSSAFVRMPERGYGTRSSLVVRVTAGGDAVSGTNTATWQVSLDEWTHGHGGGQALWSASGHRREELVW
jgi:uncharacterized protein with NRDE domain